MGTTDKELVSPEETQTTELTGESIDKPKPMEELMREPMIELAEQPMEKPKEPAENSAKHTAQKLLEEALKEPVTVTAKELMTDQFDERVEQITQAARTLLEEASIEKQESEIMDRLTVLTPEPTPASPDVPKKRSQKRYKIIFICGIFPILALLACYLGIAQYYKNHFFWGSEINGIDISGKTLDEVKEIISAGLKDYTLRIKTREGKTEQIKAGDIDLQYGSNEEFKKFKDDQNKLLWITAFFSDGDYKNAVNLTYNEKLLKDHINRFSCLKPINQVEPKNPRFKYKNKRYVIVREIIGTKVNKNLLTTKIVNAIRDGQTEIDLESAGCYIKPQYNSKSKKVVETRNTLNKYISAKITYTYEDEEDTLDGPQINKWITIDKNYNIIINRQRAKEYISKLSKTYNPVSVTRNFKTSSEEIISITGGDYGKTINIDKEVQNLISAVKEGTIVTKELAYVGSDEIGNTYVEISLTKQHIWFYKNGSLLVEGPVVTGNVRQNFATRKGVFSLKAKSRNTILSGPGYSVHVTYWMPFDGGIGIHDANWRKAFGNNIYLTNGSHGCVNCPFYVAQRIFNHITPGTPVICY